MGFQNVPKSIISFSFKVFSDLGDAVRAIIGGAMYERVTKPAKDGDKTVECNERELLVTEYFTGREFGKDLAEEESWMYIQEKAAKFRAHNGKLHYLTN